MQEPPAPEIAFDARIKARREVGAGLFLVTLDAPEEALAAHTRPGQYIWLGSWFVLASPPGHASWDVVLRPAGDAAIALVRAPIGTAIPAAGPFGDGFPIARGATLVIAATGGAIAAVRAVMEDRIEHDEARATHLYLGASLPDELPLADELASWRAAGATVVPCISSEEGRVQDVARKRLGVPAGTIVLLAGHPGMIEGMQALAQERGWSAHVNY